MLSSSLKCLFRSVTPKIARQFYAKLDENAKLVIFGRSSFEVSCFSDSKADENMVYISDNSNFHVKDGCEIVQFEIPKTCVPTKIQIPIFRDIFVRQISDSPINVVGYQCSNAVVESNGPLLLKKLKIDKFVIDASADIVSEGFTGSSLSVKTSKSFSATNLICEEVNLSFGGPNVHIQSVYSKSLNLRALPQEDFSVIPEDNPFSVTLGTLHGNANIEIDGCAKLSIGSLEGSLRVRQRLGDVSVHISGECPLVEIDVAEGDVELSLPVSLEGAQIAGFLDLTGSKIQLDHNSLPSDCLDNFDLTELPGCVGFTGTFGITKPESEIHMWRIRTLHGKIVVRGSSWSDAMLKYLNEVNSAN